MALPALGIALKTALSGATKKLLSGAVVKSTTKGMFAVKSGKKVLSTFASKRAANNFASGYNHFLNGGKLTGIGRSEVPGFYRAQKDVSKIANAGTKAAYGAGFGRVGSRYSAPKRGFRTERGRGSRPSSSQLNRPSFSKGNVSVKSSSIRGPSYSNITNAQKSPSVNYSNYNQSPKFAAPSVSHGNTSIRYGNSSRSYNFSNYTKKKGGRR